MTTTKEKAHDIEVNHSTGVTRARVHARTFVHYLFAPFWTLLSPILQSLYVVFQSFIHWGFKPTPPPENWKPKNPRGRIAVVGAGLTGVSSAAHAVAHGFEVVIFEADSKAGGIWARVNSTSALQLNSVLYRFHPGVTWSEGFPSRDEILGQIEGIWKEYQLEPRTRFETPVTSVQRADKKNEKDKRSRWIINDNKDEVFDAVIVTVGTCGKPMYAPFPGMPVEFMEEKGIKQPEADEHWTEEFDVYRGTILHSSELDSLEEGALDGKRLIVVGSGASGVEAVETALDKGAKKCYMLARDDKWIIPRNLLIDTLIAMQPFGRQMPLSFIWEYFIRWFHYTDLADLSPTGKGLFEGTPVVNNQFLDDVRLGRCDYVRGDTLRLTSKGALVNKRVRGTKPGDDGVKAEIEGDIVVLATGFEKPTVDFLPKDLFPEKYQRPNLYLQTFSTEDWSILMTNSAYMNAIGSVGHIHIGIYTRILLTFLMDRNSRPPPEDMKLWVDVISFIKRYTTGERVGFTFFTYMELTLWFVMFHIFRIDRLKWIFFVMQGWGVPYTE